MIEVYTYIYIHRLCILTLNHLIDLGVIKNRKITCLTHMMIARTEVRDIIYFR